MDEDEERPEKSAKDTDKLKLESKEPKLSLGDYLLEKEFERNKISQDIVANHKLKKTKSNQNE